MLPRTAPACAHAQWVQGASSSPLQPADQPPAMLFLVSSLTDVEPKLQPERTAK